MLANRLSWWYDFRGPSKDVDTGVEALPSMPCALRSI